MDMDLMEMRQFILNCMMIDDMRATCEEESVAKKPMRDYIQSLKPGMSIKDEENLRKASLWFYLQMTSTLQEEEITKESLFGTKLVGLVERTDEELYDLQLEADWYAYCAEVNYDRPKHRNSSIDTRVDTCTSVDDLIVKKQEEIACVIEAIEEKRMVHDWQLDIKAKPKFYEVDLSPVYEIYKEWETKEDEEVLRQKKFWENFKDLSQFPEEQPFQIMPESSHGDSKETTVPIGVPQVSGSYCRKKDLIGVKKSATQPKNQPRSRLFGDLTAQFSPTYSTEVFKPHKPLETRKIISQAPVPFARKRLDLSIYTFDDFEEEEASEDSIEDATDKDYTYGDNSEKKSKYMKHRPKIKKAKSKEQRSLAKLTKKLSSLLNPLKRTLWNSGRRWRYRRKKVIVSTVVNYV